MKQALTIAGSDSGGGAGIQADLKTFAALGVYGTSVITAVTAQNTRAVEGSLALPAAFVGQQIEAVLSDFQIAAAKTGMLADAEIILAVASAWETHGVKSLVVDPVMVSKSGHRLLREDAVSALMDELVPLARVVTPNLHEAALLAGFPIESLDDMRRAAETIGARGPRAVLVKGGHAAFALAVDILWEADGTFTELHPHVPPRERSVHGTGCTLSAAITARLALGDSIRDAVSAAKRYVTRVIESAPAVGHGHPPGHHFYFLSPDDWDK